jgi:hypothetical protein
MEKDLREDEIKELEEEIDSAVDRLFVENQKGLGNSVLKGPSSSPPSFEADRESEPAFRFEPPSIPIPPAPAGQSKPLSFEGPDELEQTFDFEPSPVSVEPKPSKEPKPLSFDTLDELEESFDLEPSPVSAPAESGPPPQPPPYLKSIDQLEAQLLSLEWEITHDKLQKTREEVGALRELLKQRKDIGSILGFMGSVLDRMISDEEKIDPASIKFLLDAKETIKLSFEKEGEREFEIYKQLAIEGIEARFRGLGNPMKPLPELPSSSAVEPSSEKAPSERTQAEWVKAEELLARWNHFYEKAESLLQRMDRRMCDIERGSHAPAGGSGEGTLSSMDITVFKSYGKLYGVESLKVMRLYKVPASFEERYGDRPKVRVRDKVVTLIDLKKTFPEESWLPAETSRLLMVEEEGEFKGLIVEEVLKRIITSPSDRGKNGKPVLGLVHWNYRAHPVDVPILDIKRL